MTEMRNPMTTRKFFSLLLFLALVLSASPIDWRQCPQILPGVRHCRLALTEPRLMKVNILRVDLATPGLRFAGTPRSQGWGNPMPDYPKGIIRTFRQTTEDFMKWNRRPWNQGGRGRNMIVAVNSAPWTPWTSPYTHLYGDPAGLMISNGVLIADNPQAHQAQFVVYRNGRVDIVPEIPKEDYPNVWLTAGGFRILMKNGELVNQGDKSIHPRMVYGLSQDRRWLFLMSIDGRQKEWSIGAMDQDSAALMKDAGAWDVINMDGGGSTTLCVWDFNAGKPVVLSQNAGKAVRRVGGNIGIYLEH